MSKKVLTDNKKIVVTERKAGKVILNAQFSYFAVEIGFLPRMCQISMPQAKGKAERLVRHMKENFFPSPSSLTWKF